MLQIAAFATTRTEVEEALHSVLNVHMPKKIGKAVEANGRRVLKTGADQYWVLTSEGDDVSRSIREVVHPGIGTAIPLSHAYARLFIEGPAAPQILATGVALDFHPGVFDIGQFAATGLHHTPVLILRSDQIRYELFTLRTFAVWVWDRLADAISAL